MNDEKVVYVDFKNKTTAEVVTRPISQEDLPIVIRDTVSSFVNRHIAISSTAELDVSDHINIQVGYTDESFEDLFSIYSDNVNNGHVDSEFSFAMFFADTVTRLNDLGDYLEAQMVITVLFRIYCNILSVKATDITIKSYSLVNESANEIAMVFSTVPGDDVRSVVINIKVK